MFMTKLIFAYFLPMTFFKKVSKIDVNMSSSAMGNQLGMPSGTPSVTYSNSLLFVSMELGINLASFLYQILIDFILINLKYLK